MKDSTEDLTILIPAKSSSERCTGKNYRVFHEDKILLEIKLAQLKKYFKRSRIILFPDSDEAIRQCEQLAKKHDMDVDIIQQTVTGDFCYDFMYLVERANTEYVMRLCVTTPFLSGQDMMDMYSKLIEMRAKEGYDSCLAVQKITYHLVNEHGQPINYGYGRGHVGSELLEPMYSVEASTFILPREVAIKYRYHFGKKPYLYEFDRLKSLDINTEEDWQNARDLANIKKYAEMLER